jgi:hypothetical protein
MTEIRRTDDYNELQSLLWYLRHNYKTRVSHGIYHNSDKTHKLRPIFAAWRKDVIRLLQEGRTIEARLAIRKVNQVRIARYGCEKETVIWDLIHKYDENFYYLKQNKHFIPGSRLT